MLVVPSDRISLACIVACRLPPFPGAMVASSVDHQLACMGRTNNDAVASQPRRDYHLGYQYRPSVVRSALP
jgi:hypothetical protein